METDTPKELSDNLPTPVERFALQALVDTLYKKGDAAIFQVLNKIVEAQEVI